MESISNWIEQVFGFDNLFQQKIYLSAVAILVLVIIRWLLIRLVVRRFEDGLTRYQWKKTITYVLTFLGVVVILGIWLEAGQSFATYIGLVSAALVVALQDPITNMVGWAFIFWRRPFEVGDRIQIGEVQGDVVDLRLFQFSMMEIGNWVAADQSTGRIIHIPNRRVFSSEIANYSKGSDYIWNEIPVLITFESDWRKAKQLLQSIADQHTMEIDQQVEQSFRRASEQYYLKYKKLTPAVYTSVKDSGVLLTIRYLHEPRQRRNYEQILWEVILAEFARHDDIDFAYPTQRFYNYVTEGMN